jgi:hypothetical protein
VVVLSLMVAHGGTIVAAMRKGWRWLLLFFSDTIKELMSYPKCRSVKVINNPARPGSNHREVNYINYH